jgi:hypothetical protein
MDGKALATDRKSAGVGLKRYDINLDTGEPSNLARQIANVFAG